MDARAMRREIDRLRARVATLEYELDHDALVGKGLRRAAALVVVRSGGMVEVYAGRRVAVEVVQYPVFDRRLDRAGVVDELVRLRLPKSHRGIAFDVRRSTAAYTTGCPTLKAFVDGLDREAEFKWWDEVGRILREAKR